LRQTISTVLVMASQPVSPFLDYDVSNTGFSRQHRTQDLSPFRWTGSQIRSVVSGLPTSSRATTGRRPLNPLTTVQVRPLRATPPIVKRRTPPFQTQQASFPALRFPVLDVTSSGSLRLRWWIRVVPVEAHQSEHSLTCCMESPAMPENKAPLLFPSFAFLNTSILPRVKRLSLADLHHVPAITAGH
jgi:hypothetical protein